MALIPSLGETAHLSDFFRAFPDHTGPLLQHCDGILRGDGELSVAERELIAAYVSGLNACKFCTDSHRIYAEAFGINEGTVDALLTDLESAPVDAKFKPLLRYVRKLNHEPSRMVSADSKAVFDAGWNEIALVEAVRVCALFNLFNRLVLGAGVNFDYGQHRDTHPAARGDSGQLAHSYLDFGRRLGVID